MAKHPASNQNPSPSETGTPVKPGKGTATPSRREQEAARRRPLVPNDRREAARAARAQAATEREKARAGVAMGDERYLPVRDRGPQKRFVRDYVDARFSIGEIIIPAMLVVILLGFIPGLGSQAISIFVLWGVFLVAIVDCIALGYIVRRKLAEKYGESRVEKVRFYAAMRALQLRPMRLPKPQVKRRQYPS